MEFQALVEVIGASRRMLSHRYFKSRCGNQTVHYTVIPALLKLPSETLNEVTRALTGAAFLKLRATCIDLHALEPPTVHPTLGPQHENQSEIC